MEMEEKERGKAEENSKGREKEVKCRGVRKGVPIYTFPKFLCIVLLFFSL